MELKKFRNKYDLELIPASHDGIILGTLVWDPIIGKPEFDHGGMPNNIFTSFHDAEFITEDEWSLYMNDLRTRELGEAHFAESTINVDTNIATTLEYPTIGKISNSFNLNKVVKFTFGDLKVKVMADLTRIRIDNYLESLKKEKWDDYDGKIRRVFMVTELYYGSIKMVTKTDWADELDATIPKLDLKLSNKVELGKSVEYTFDHQNVPFAMRIERVRDFNG